MKRLHLFTILAVLTLLLCCILPTRAEAASVSDLVIPATLDGKPVTAIDNYAFENCSSLQDVYYRGTKSRWTGNEQLLTATLHTNEETVSEILSQPVDQTVMEGKYATFSVQYSGSEGVTYQWQYKGNTTASSEVWRKTTADGNQTDTITVLAKLTNDGYSYRCVITDPNHVDEDGKVVPIYTDQVFLHVTKKPSAIVTQPESVIAKAGTGVNFAVETQGEEIRYLWQFKDVGDLEWTDCTQSGFDTASITVPNITVELHGRQYRCVITDVNDGTEYTEYTEIVTLQIPYIVKQPETVQVYENTKAKFSVEYSMVEGVTYQWQYRSADAASSWANATDTGNTTNSLTVNATMAMHGYQYRCVITDPNCVDEAGNAEPIYSDEVTLNVESAFDIITAHPEDQTALAGKTVTFSVAGQGAGLSYQWQYKNPDSEEWINSGLSGSKTATLTVANLTVGHHNRQYRCVVTNAEDKSENSLPATLRIPYIAKQPEDAWAHAGDYATFTIEYTVPEGVVYQWQYKGNTSSSIWRETTAQGNKTNTIHVLAKDTNHGYQYRCVIVDPRNVDENGKRISIYSSEVSLNIVDPSTTILSQPEDLLVRVGGTAQFTVKTVGEGLSYGWQYKNSNSTSWNKTSLSGYNTNTLIVSNVGTGHHGRQYRCVITKADGSTVTSEAATLTVPYIVKQPKTAFGVQVNQDQQFTISYSVSEGVTYQWQYKGNTSSSTWANTGLPGAKTSTLTVTALSTRNGYQYRCIINDNGVKVTSDAAILYVQASKAVVTKQPVATSAVCGDYATFRIEATGEGLTYHWQWYHEGTKTWVSTYIAGYHTPELRVKTNNFNGGRLYRCRIRTVNGSGWNEVYTEPAMLTVLPAATIKLQPQNVTKAVGQDAVFRVSATGDGLTYQWQWAKFVGNWKNTTASGANTDTLTIFNVNQEMDGRYYRVIITNKYDGTITTEYAQLFVE